MPDLSKLGVYPQVHRPQDSLDHLVSRPYEDAAIAAREDAIQSLGPRSRAPQVTIVYSSSAPPEP